MFRLFQKNRKNVFIRCYSDLTKIKNIVSQYTDLPENEAISFLFKYKLKDRTEDFLIDSFETYKKFGFSTKEIVKNGRLFKYYPREHEQHFWVMEESGFTKFEPQVLIRARSLLKRKISTLKEQGYIPEDTNVADSFLSFIDNPDFQKTINIEYNDSLTWTEVHFSLARQFLAWRLQTSDREIEKLLLIHPGIYRKSFRIMEENISMAQGLGFSLQKILKCGYIIRNFPEYTKQTLKEFPTLAGYDMRSAMRSYPTLIVTPTVRIRKTYQVLKEFNISDESIRTEMGIFQVSPETIRQRLEEVACSPDTKPLLKIPRLLTHLLHHTKAKSRLPFLQQMNLKCTNYYVLTAPNDDVLEKFIRMDKDINCKKDVCTYLKKLLMVDDLNDLIDKISRHPYYPNVPLKDVVETFNYLIICGFKRPNIYKALWILLYPMETVQATLQELKNDSNLPFQSINQVQKLNLILYTIEKDHHFTGHGIFGNLGNDFQQQSMK